jgi:hypothetical protein
MGDTALLTRLSLANTKLNPLIRGLVKDDQKIKPMPNEAHRVWWFVQFGKQQNLSRRPVLKEVEEATLNAPETNPGC